MRALPVLALIAASVFVPFAAGEDEDHEPSMDAKEWAKQKSGLEIWDVKEGQGEVTKPGAHHRHPLHRLADRCGCDEVR